MSPLPLPADAHGCSIHLYLVECVPVIVYQDYSGLKSAVVDPFL